VLLAPSEEIEVGLYSLALPVKQAPSLATQPLTRVDLQVSASASCPEGRRMIRTPKNITLGDALNNCRFRGQPFRFPQTTLDLCAEAFLAAENCALNGWNPDACLTAAVLDLQIDQLRVPNPQGGRPWPSLMGCTIQEFGADRTLQYIHYGWEWTAQFGSFLRGEEFLGSYASTADGSAFTATLGYKTGNREADRESRTFVLFPPIISIQ
jgi:hypothetical protein